MLAGGNLDGNIISSVINDQPDGNIPLVEHRVGIYNTKSINGQEK